MYLSQTKSNTIVLLFLLRLLVKLTCWIALGTTCIVFVSLNRYYLALWGILIQISTCSFLASLFGYHFLKFLYVLYIFYRTLKEISTRTYCAIFFKFHFSYIIFSVWVSVCCIFSDRCTDSRETLLDYNFESWFKLLL